MTDKPVFDYPLFAKGFRVFFALAGLSALALIAAWNAMTRGALHLEHYYPADLWHGHEMLLGYAPAVLAGFLLIAVQGWTGRRPASQDLLAGLALLWIYGRVAPFYAGLLPDALIALLDWLFLPALAATLAAALLHSRQYRYLWSVVLLLILAAVNTLVHARVLGMIAGGAAILQQLLMMFVLLIVIFAGRFLPVFVERALGGAMHLRHSRLDALAVVTSLLVGACLLLELDGLPMQILAVTAMCANLSRLAAWYDRRIWFVPLLWILFAGYLWLTLGFGLLAMAPGLAVHAFGIGALGVLSLGIMARLALGQSGRVVKVSNLMAMAFLLINLAAFCQIMLPAVAADGYRIVLQFAGYAWLAAFSLFIFQYAPIFLDATGEADS